MIKSTHWHPFIQRRFQTFNAKSISCNRALAGLKPNAIRLLDASCRGGLCINVRKLLCDELSGGKGK
jgi:hypothetical protein